MKTGLRYVVFVSDIPLDEEVIKTLETTLCEIFKGSISETTEVVYEGGNRCEYLNPLQNYTINFADVFYALARSYYLQYGEKAYKKELIKFANKLGLFCMNGFPYVKRYLCPSNYLHDIHKPKDALMRITSSHLWQLPAYILGYTKMTTTDKKNMKVNLNPRPWSPVNIDRALKGCKLFKELYHGERELSHVELKHLASSFVQSSTGRKHFLSILGNEANQRFQYNIEEWDFYTSYMKELGCTPYECKENCPHHEQCSHHENMAETVIGWI